MDATAATTTDPVAQPAVEPAAAATDTPVAAEPQSGIRAGLANAISDRAQILEANRQLTQSVGDLRQRLAATEARANTAEAELATARAQADQERQKLEAAHTAELASVRGQVQSATAAIPAQVASATVDTMAQLGVPESALPAAGTGGDGKAAADTPTLADRERALTEKAAALVPAIGARLGLN